MVTLVILSLGLLGIAGLFVKGVSNTLASESMAKANLLAASMADRIRVNSTVAIAPTNAYLRNYGDPIPTPTTPTTIARSDVNGWLNSLAAELPQGDGTISLDSATPRKVVIGVRWSNCLGTLSESDQNTCKNDSANAFRSVTYELRL